MSVWARVRIALRALAILAVFLIIPAFFLMIAMAAALPGGKGTLSPVVSDLFSMTGCVVAVTVIVGRYRKKGILLPEAAGFALRDLSGKEAARMLAAGVGCGFVLSALLTLIPFPDPWIDSYDAASLAAFEGEGRIVAVLMSVFFMPVIEELVFRGFLTRTLLKGFSPRVSVLAVSLVFGLMHGHPLWMVYAFLCGLLLSWAALRQENLAAAMLLHMGVNISSLPRIFLQENETYVRIAANPFLLLILLILGGGLAVWALIGSGRRKDGGGLPKGLIFKGLAKRETGERYRPKHVKKRASNKNA
jgi:membrane protease YdiL (CAAX protease family)